MAGNDNRIEMAGATHAFDLIKRMKQNEALRKFGYFNSLYIYSVKARSKDVDMNKIIPLLAFGIICCRGQRAEILETHESPSGKYSLIVELGNRDNERDWTILMFKLTDDAKREVDYVRTGASDAQKWAVTWYNEKTIVLNSSDIGTLAWTVFQDGKMSEIWPVPEDVLKKGDEAYNKKYKR